VAYNGALGMVNVGLSMSVALLVHSTAASAELLAKEVIETKEQDITKIRVSGMVRDCHGPTEC
jgi:hypothetical protein